MFNSDDFELVREYRQRQMTRAENYRKIQSAKQQQGNKHSRLHPSVISLLLLSGSIITLIVFFALPAQFTVL